MTQQEAEAFLGQSEQSILDQPLTGEDVALALSDPDYEPTQEQFALYKEYAKNKQTDWFGALNAGIDSIINTAGKAAEQAVTSGAAINPANYAEGVLQNVRGTYEMVAQSSNPDSWAFRFKDLLFGTGTEQSQYSQFLEARKFNAQSEKYQRGEETILPKEYVNPEFAQGVALIADPTLLLPGVGEVLGGGKFATRLMGKAAQIAGKGVTAIAKPAERALQLGERLAVEATGLTPEALRGAAVATGAAGLVGGTPALALGAAVPAAVTTARELGEAITAAGANLVTQPSRIGALEAIGRIPGASLRQRTIGIIGQYGGDLALDTALRSTAGAIEGAAIGGALGYYSGGKEGAAAGIGSGGTLGAAGATAGRAYERLTGRAAAEARKGDFDRYVAAQDEKTAGNLLQLEADHGTDIASAYMDATELMRGMMGDVNVTLLDKKEYTDKFGKTRGVTVEAGDRPAIYVNADVFGKGRGDTPLYTLGHEMFHALEKSEQLATKASDIKDALVGKYLEEGGVSRKIAEGAYNDAEILKRFEQYRDKLPATAADELSKYDTIQKKADFIASELAAEHLGILVSGQKPDALLRGLTGLKRELVDWALTQNSSKAISRMAEAIERTTGLKPVDSVLYPDLKQASPQVNAMLRDLLRARKRLDEAVVLSEDNVTRALKPSDMGNPVAAKTAVELGIAEQDPKTGSTRWFSDDEMRVREERDNKAVQDILTAVPGARVVDGVVSGRFSPEQLSAIEQSQQVSGRMKDKIRAVSSAMSNGNSLWVNYGAATRRVKNRLTGKYSSKYSSGIRLSQREVLPYSFNISKADNPYINVMDISKMRGQLEKSVRPDGSVANMWSSIDDFMSDLARYFTNLDRGESAKRSVEIFGEDKAKFLGDFVNEGEKGGRKYVRSLRIDRIGSVEPRNFKANISEDAIQKSKLRWMPDEQVGDKTVNKSEEGFTIVRGEKVRLYDPAGKLVGIYDNQAIAERKADDIQRKTELGIGRAVQESRFRAEPSIDGERFHNAIARTKSEHDFGFAVDDKGRDFYTDPGTQLFLSNDGLAGVAVTDYGDLVSVFKHPSSAANIKPILSEAARFSQTLDAFEINGFLPNLYSEFGFKPVARVAFNREFAPPGWRYDLAGEPDVVLMVKDSKNVTDLPSITNKNYLSLKQSVPLVSYDEALALQNQYKKEIYATQTGLQPEVGQQQYQARDEVRQAAEASGRNRDVGGAQGGAEGGQTLGSVRQARDVIVEPGSETFTIPKSDIVRFMPASDKVRLEDYADRKIIALAADRMGIGQMIIGPKESRRELSVQGQGGRGFMNIFNGGGWAFSDKKTADRFLKRLKKESDKSGNAIVGITVQSPINHLKNQTGQLAYIEAMQAAIDSGVITKKAADEQVAVMSSAIVNSTAKSVKLSAREKFNGIRSFNDLKSAITNKQLNFADMEPLLKQMQRKKLPITEKELKAAGISPADIARDIADPELLDIPFGSVVALLQVNVKQLPENTGFHYAYPWTVNGEAIGYLDKFYNISDLSTEKKIRNKSGVVTAQPLQTVMPVMDNIINTIKTKQGIPSTPSARFKATSEDIRYMPETIQRDVGRNQDFANPPTDTEAVDALSSEKKAKFGAARSIKPGTQVAARIDIPAFLRTGKYVVAVHEPDGAAGGPGKVIGYDTVTRLQNPKFVVKPGVQRIYEGKSAKFPVATVDGKIMSDRSIPADLENYVPVGMDPKEHAYFYDKRTDQPVIGGSESVSVGNTVFVKNPVYGDPSQFAFMPSPDSAMPGAYSFPGGYRALPAKAKGKMRVYGPLGQLVGIASSLDEAQRMVQRKLR